MQDLGKSSKSFYTAVTLVGNGYSTISAVPAYNVLNKWFGDGSNRRIFKASKAVYTQ